MTGLWWAAVQSFDVVGVERNYAYLLCHTLLGIASSCVCVCIYIYVCVSVCVSVFAFSQMSKREAFI